VSSSIGRDFPGLRVLDGTLASGVRFAVTTREGGASVGAYARGNLADHVGDSAGAVVINRALLQDALGAHRGLAVIAAVHGASTAWVNAAGTYGDVDGLLTEVEGLGILALGADCAVVGVAATRLDGTPVIGVAHCGWRGLVADAVGTLVGQIQSAGGRDLHAILGPTICGACYLIDEERSRQVLDACTPDVGRVSVSPAGRSGQFRLDIRAGVRQRLTELGVAIELDCGCTAEDERWFSHRAFVNRFGPDAQTGRHGLGLVITDSRPGKA
jgi:polyphenol oxidase